MAASCPACGRPVAVARPQCLYCGGVLPAVVVAEAARQAETAAHAATPLAATGAFPAAPGPRRSLVALHYEGADAAALQAALDVSAFEAGQRVRRGGWHLHRIAPEEEASREAERLGLAGLRVLVLPEEQVRAAARPVLVSGGFWEGTGLTLRTETGPVNTARPLLVVRGPITREYATPASARRVQTATLAPGYRFHLHRAADPRPLELDPAAFDFGLGNLTESSQLLLSAWIDRLAAGAPVDDGFRREPPALGLAAPETTGIASALKGAAERRRGEEAQVLDNLEQFRFYSAWRGLVRRQG